MESVASNQVSYGHSCVRCRTYFVTYNRTELMCPWCQRIEAGAHPAESLEGPDDPQV
jgi:hypothetical protein